MMWGTHRFFLTERSLYLLVLEDRRQTDRSINDWMKTIRKRGKNSPVIVVINKSDKGKQELCLDERALQESYPNIAAFLRTSTDPDKWAADSIEALRQKIVEIITKKAARREVTLLDPNWLNTPYLGNWPKDVLRFRYVYSYLPPGLIPRFIVQSPIQHESDRGKNSLANGRYPQHLRVPGAGSCLSRPTARGY